MTTAWLLSIFATSSTSAVVMSFPSARASATWPRPRELGTPLAGGWSVNWSATLQGGQPITLPCPIPTAQERLASDSGSQGQSAKLGLHTDSNGKLSWFGNPAAFSQPCKLGAVGGRRRRFPVRRRVASFNRSWLPWAVLRRRWRTPLPATGFLGLQRLPALRSASSCNSVSEFFNILNHPNFNAPGFGGNGVVAHRRRD